jgi:hypothetical protein
MRRPLLVAAVALGLVVSTAPAAEALTREISPTDGATNDQFGTSVAMDGDTLVVGAPIKDSGAGAAYVYTRTANETWTQTSKLTASDRSNGDGFGASVAIDGDTIVVGASGDDSGAGSIYLFPRSGTGSRTQADRVTASDRANGDALGSAVDIDGDVIVAGAPGDSNVGAPDGAGHGSVYTFTRTGTAGRNQSAKLTASDNTLSGCIFCGSLLGDSVAIDGDTIVAGAPRDYFGNTSAGVRGSVYTFASTGASDRQETAKLVVSGQTAGRVGESVDIDGDTIVAGDSQGDDAFGAAWLFDRDGPATRNQVGKLTPANPSQNKQFGASVSISSTFIAVGAPTFATAGSGFVFTRTGTPNRTEVWQTRGTVIANELYGTSIVTDGDRVVGGAPTADASGPFVQDRGRVYSSSPALFATSTGTGSGTITSSTGGISGCSFSCTEEFLLGDQTTLTATASPGSHFAGWENYSGCSGTGTCTVTMNGEPQVAARFTLGSPPDDTTPPAVNIVGGPAQGSTITTSSTAFSFSADENVTFQCKVDTGSYGACSTSTATSGTHGLTGLAEGPHTFAVRATDTAGNPSVEKTRTFTVDLPPPPDKTPPQTTVTTKPPRKVSTSKKKAKVTLGFTASERSTFLCKVDDAAYKTCRSPFKVRLALGKHTILVVAVDAAGNRDGTPAKVVVKVKKKQQG